MNMFTSAILTLILLVSMDAGTTAKTWSVRFIEPASAKLFKPIITANGITIQSLGTDVTQRKDHPEYISLHCRLPDAITAVSFDYAQIGDASSMPITLLDVTSREL